ncbi:MAG: gliding motility-associated C-terminal domain-containing protein [Brumimicrobium sp.]|nr:gliding motility-associated C-terminal domain-containing protein [Brumimicrobium sp.]MCO5267845.1 gliding motility-associated C-terminal domain-containing protein [Brumimicrobium sp.]
MFKQIRKLLILFLLVMYAFTARATHGMGGDITWHCLGNGQYIFELKFYRDCNGFDVNINYETLQVWGHPNLTSIQVNYISRTDISPTCTPASGYVPFTCGSGTGGGSGVGAVEEILYRSDPISISGTPPVAGWKFTFQNFSRSANLTNIQSPTTYGITLSATMYPVPGNTGGCIDNSPIFLQSPYIVSCAGEQYEYNPNVVDPDLDSLVFDWGKPLDYFPTGSFSPPTNPAPVPFVAGFSYDNPTPGPGFNAGNQAAVLDSETGKMTFKSFTIGNFATKIVIDSYRAGIKIASVERETQLIINNCSGNNNAPVITPPFASGTSFETEVFAGDLVQFSINVTDNDNLQNGNPQSVTVSSSGLMYGANFTNPGAGCSIIPCATLAAPSVTNVQTATLGFDWQTSCDHLVDATGNAQAKKTYVFVFKVQDDYCPIPMVKYATVKVTLKNKDVLPAPTIKCISYQPNGDVKIEWDPVSDPYGTFSGYKINGVNGGVYGMVNNINANSYIIVGGVVAPEQFFVSTMSGCGGLTARNSDTISSIFLTLDNPGDGRAKLNWTQPHIPPLPSFGNNYDIYKEYPAGIWTLINTVPYGTTVYFDTITTCSDWINYKVVLSTQTCDFVSNVVGDVFKDKIVPDMPTIYSASVDTLSGNIIITWDVNKQEDTYGYVIYMEDQFGNIVPIDTVWGRNNTTYIYAPSYSDAYKYSVAAFDSCYTTNIPPTYQTSAKAEPHTTIYLQNEVDVCARLVTLNWTKYEGWQGVDHYNIYVRKNGQSWVLESQANGLSYSMDIVAGDIIVAVVEAVSTDGIRAFSNRDTANFVGTAGPSMSYLSVATVDGENVRIRYRISTGESAQSVQLQRWNPQIQEFEKIDEKAVGNDEEISFIDSDVEVNRRSYTYRAKIIDTCGRFVSYSNIGRTMYLTVSTDQANETHTLQWNPYEDFIGGLLMYQVYRAIDGENFGTTAIATLPYNVRTFVDTIGVISSYDDGRICYYVAAREASSQVIKEASYSNIACGVLDPIIFIPNAFTVGGRNPIFQPITGNHQLQDYLFEIYDRYGRVIFSTNNPDEGWNGQLKGQTRIAQEGVYVFRVALKDGNGMEHVTYGHVTLLDYTKVDY